MRLTKPRFAPLSDAELSPEQAEALEPMRLLPRIGERLATALAQRKK